MSAWRVQEGCPKPADTSWLKADFSTPSDSVDEFTPSLNRHELADAKEAIERHVFFPVKFAGAFLAVDDG
jgi:hypothetical protein